MAAPAVRVTAQKGSAARSPPPTSGPSAYPPAQTTLITPADQPYMPVSPARSTASVSSGPVGAAMVPIPAPATAKAAATQTAGPMPRRGSDAAIASPPTRIGVLRPWRSDHRPANGVHTK